MTRSRQLPSDGETREAELRDALERAGKRWTRQREAVYDFLLTVDSHPTAEQVFAAVRRDVSHISLATVYKALDALVESGMATRLVSDDGIARYDGRGDSHHHLRCLKTGEVRDLPMPYDPGLIERVDPTLLEWLEREGFELMGHRLELIVRRRDR